MQMLSAGATLQRSASMLMSSLPGAGAPAVAAAPASPIEAAVKAASDTAAVIDSLESALEKNRDEDAPRASVTYAEPEASRLKKAASGKGDDEAAGNTLALTSLSLSASQTTISANQDGASATSKSAQIEVTAEGIFLASAEVSLSTATTPEGRVTTGSYSWSRAYLGSAEGFSRYADAFA
ncbi:hypothetical protein [Methylobrevis pamukkalensis]|uniref:Uncharacterized protein n=1 Tax=Methylobrevis pamukkalensis TaxID=1439726 RepID=A0A1E3GYP1_9HYPH|nr:hypothetical protein [Methylobrevis pamukkalensis]ODN69188.1 hypothetical protein A6302_03498 [Methylobrevis pamukkalensis]